MKLSVDLSDDAAVEKLCAELVAEAKMMKESIENRINVVDELSSDSSH